jgi:alpha-aminoadipic semialdehyde synthase
MGQRFFLQERAITVGIYRESYNHWESRAPLTPTQVEQLLSDDKKLSFVVQPSAQRIFSNDAYAQAGAKLQDDLSQADVILGVKRPLDPSTLLPNKSYLFFSHTIKGQAENMGLLQTCLDKNIQLLDYERMVSSGSEKPKRLVSFGRFAGMAGTIDSFHALGRRLLYRDGATTPFLACPMAAMNNNLDQAKERVTQMGDLILEGMDLSEPLVFGVTGKGGAVHGGVMEILQLLPHQIVPVNDLPQVFNSASGPQRQIYICPVGLDDIFQHHTETTTKFDRNHFQDHSGEYRSLFASRMAPFVHCIINAVCWNPRFPRLLTNDEMKKICERGNER